MLTSLPKYFDCGDANYICQYCLAVFWAAERLMSVPSRQAFRYTQCCRTGTVCFPFPLEPPPALRHLFTLPHFMDKIRAYNSMFSMTSFGAVVDEKINNGRGPYVFRVSGQISHWMGTLCPIDGESPRFLQLYIYDTMNEVANRLQIFSNTSTNSLSAHFVSTISRTLSTCNEYVRLFKTAAEMDPTSQDSDFCIRLFSDVPDRRYASPVPGTIGGIVRDGDNAGNSFDIIVRFKDGTPQRVSKLHPSYMPLQYPLFFPFAEQGWSPSLKLRGDEGARARNLTTNMYYSYQIHDRNGVYSLLLRGGRLFQQYLVDAYMCIEQGRLDYLYAHQKTLRTEYASGVYDAVSNGDCDANQLGKRIFLPSSFTGGPRYMYKHYQDALAICRVHGNPQYFVTFTCNAKWPEITRYMSRVGVSQAQDRPDIIARIFQIKVVELFKYLRDQRVFGDIVADLYTIEFQKRGLPHCHALIWVSSSFKIDIPADVDKYISAELPDPILEPDLYRIISECMIHGPCGLPNPKNPCMRDGLCSKKFPKEFTQTTSLDKDGYMHYRRRFDGRFVIKNGIPLDNAYVVPYNNKLSSKFAAHINVEYCGWAMLIKYLFKYISKGTDRIRFSIGSVATQDDASTSNSPPVVNEIKRFQDGRYVCPHEAAWRILNFPIHERHPSVLVLAVHAKGMQSTTFRNNKNLDTVISNPAFGKTTLTQWMYTNSIDASARNITYADFPTVYRWDSAKFWIRRSRKQSPQIGRLIYIHPATGELFFLRLLLCHMKGCCSFDDLRTVGSHVYSTYKETCEVLGYTGDDREWISAFVEASVWATSVELRALFVHLLLFCDIGSPHVLWDSHWRKMSDDILVRIRTSLPNQHYSVDDNDLKQYVLLELEVLLNGSTPSKSLKDYGLPMPSDSTSERLTNRLLLEETAYDRARLSTEYRQMVGLLNSDQLCVYNRVIYSIENNSQSLLFVYGHGGTGKTFLWTTIISQLRSTGKIVLAVAASGIASLLLPSGRTAHSRFKIPIDFTDKFDCNMSKKTQLASLLRETCLIIWDEAPMNDRRCFECLDTSLRDIRDDNTRPFGGISVLLGGDFRQTLPVKPKCTPSHIIASTIPRSFLWKHFTLCKLTINMRLQKATASSSTRDSAIHFAAWLLALGDGVLGEKDRNDSPDTKTIQIPHHFLFSEADANLNSLIGFIYDRETLSHPTASTMSNRAIVCPKNETADEINSLILATVPGESRTYASHDTITPHTQNQGDIATLYPLECLQHMNFPGIPPHNLDLKINVPVMLLRNMNQTLGLCNGTRLLITQLLPTIIEAHIITGTCTGKRVYIPRIKFVHNNKELPFVFTRRQYPIKICYAMTINKSQGQSLDKIGVYLKQPVFTHGQLYVACSRATSPTGIKVLIEPEVGDFTSITKNVVFFDFIEEINQSSI